VHGDRIAYALTTGASLGGVVPKLQKIMDATCRLASLLTLGVTLLLFLQWPLRDAIGSGSTQANDMAQGLFALYVACALRHAGVRRAHLVARPVLAPRTDLPSWRAVGSAMCVLPWAVCVLGLSTPFVLRSVLMLERFPESYNAGYFVIKLALLLLAALLALQALLDLSQALRRPRR
jgi:TRAP-type mannitol/chloroaromatic compound transport system permease small subunit